MTPLGRPLLQKVGLGVSWKPAAIQHLPTGESDYQELQGGRRCPQSSRVSQDWH